MGSPSQTAPRHRHRHLQEAGRIRLLPRKPKNAKAPPQTDQCLPVLLPRAVFGAVQDGERRRRFRHEQRQKKQQTPQITDGRGDPPEHQHWQDRCQAVEGAHARTTAEVRGPGREGRRAVPDRGGGVLSRAQRRPWPPWHRRRSRRTVCQHRQTCRHHGRTIGFPCAQ